MKNIIIYPVIALTVLFSACSDYKKGNGGMLYKIIDDKDSPNVGEVAFVSVSYTEATENGKLISQTGKIDARPSMLFAGLPEFKGDFQEALKYLSEGDSAMVKIRVDSLKKYKGLILPQSDTSRYMIYSVKINKVINKNGLADTIYPQLIERYKTDQILACKAAEWQKIKTYLTQQKQSYSATNSGLLVPADLKNAGNNPAQYRVMYTFYTLDGKLLDTNEEGLARANKIYSPGDEYGPIVVSRYKAPIAAFSEAICIVPPGIKTTLIIPSKLAFGNFGNSKNIPPFTPLICDFEIVNHLKI